MTDYATMKVNISMPKKEIMNKFYELRKEYQDKLEEIDDLEDKLSKVNFLYGNTSNKLGDARQEIQQLEESLQSCEDYKQFLLDQNKTHRFTIAYKIKQLLEYGEELQKIRRENASLKGKI